MTTCPHCSGLGDEPGASHPDTDWIAMCHLCNGTGEVSDDVEWRYLDQQRIDRAAAQADALYDAVQHGDCPPPS